MARHFAGPDEILAFDVGGTTIRAGAWSPLAETLQRAARQPTPTFRTLPGASINALVDALLASMAELAAELGMAEQIAVAFPGPVTPAGDVLSAPTLWGGLDHGRPTPILTRLAALWPSARIALLNDMSAAGLYYRRRADEDFCVLTVSSGIGHKIFVGGSPFVGPNGRGGEIGHWRIDSAPDAPLCECGGRGHLSALASGAAVAPLLARSAAADPDGFHRSQLGEASGGRVERVTNEMLAEAFRAGDEWASQVVARLARPIGKALAALHLATGIERFVVTGGLARGLGPGFVERIADSAARHGWSLAGDWPLMLELGAAHDDAGMIGAARHFVAARQ